MARAKAPTTHSQKPLGGRKQRAGDIPWAAAAAGPEKNNGREIRGPARGFNLAPA